jgi:hypothetical protein
VGFEDGGELGFGEGTVELFFALSSIWAGGWRGVRSEHVFAGGGGKRLADGLEIAFEEVE